MSALADLVEVSNRVAATSSRRAKIDLIAGYLQSLEVDAVAPSVAFLSGVIPQGSLGVGWATLSEAPAPAAGPSLSLKEVMAAFDHLIVTSGAGSNATRRRITAELFGAATGAEQRFLVGLIGGEIRQGALEGVMVEA